MMRRASIVFPDPGGPVIRTLWDPAAAISIARFAIICPCTSAKSTSLNLDSAASRRLAGAIGLCPKRYSTSSPSVLGAYTVTFSQRRASPATAGLIKKVEIPASRPARTMESTPGTERISPCKESSPINITDARTSFGITPLAASTPMAIGRSRQEPSFFKSAGAKFTVTFSIGKKYPEFRIADWTRSFDSFTETAGSPTISKAGDARLISTSTVITCPFKPNVHVPNTCANIASPSLRTHSSYDATAPHATAPS